MKKQTYKGIEVVDAREIHSALEIKKKYVDWIAQQINSAELDEGIDFFPFKGISLSNRTLNCHYLTEDAAISVCVMSRGKNAKAIRKEVVSLFQKHQSGDAFTTDQIHALLDLTRAMTLVSLQKESESKHGNRYSIEHGSYSKWWDYRAQLLGYSREELKTAMNAINKRHKSTKKSLMNLDPVELIRTGVVDFFMAIGKSEGYALNAAELCKEFAIEMNLDKDIWDDLKADELGIQIPKVERKKSLFSRALRRLR